MAELTDEQKRKMKQSMMDAANMGSEEALGPVGTSVNKVFGGGRTQDMMGQKYNPATQGEDDAAERNASMRKKLIDAMPSRALEQKPTEMPMQDPQDLSSMANQSADDRMHKDESAEVKKQMLLNLLKQQRGY